MLRDEVFNDLALDLVSLQYQANPHFSTWLDKSSLSLNALWHWKKIPGIPTQVFKAFNWTCIPEGQRTRVFYSSGTTGKDASRHWHDSKSIKLYESLLLPWHREHPPWEGGRCRVAECLFLTPNEKEAPHSSLVHMFATIGKSMPKGVKSTFIGRVNSDHEWIIPLDDTIQALSELNHSVCIFGTAFLFVHLIDYLEQMGKSLTLPKGSVAFETGGYKGKSRSLTKEKLYQEIEAKLGILAKDILCEYGMSELSSQAYHVQTKPEQPSTDGAILRRLRFPPWARCRVISPETFLEVGYGETGMIQVIDLANVWYSVSVLTEDVAIRHREGFELLGRAEESEARGCSLMSDDFESLTY